MQALTFFFAFVAVLALIGVAAWAVRRFAGNRLGANTNRSRMPRLAVIDAAAVDGRRRLVLVRRDNVEHLLMIGGPTDIVVEPNIVRATAARDQMSPRPAGGTEPPSRIAPLPDAVGWSDGEAPRSDTFDLPELQMPEPPPRPARPAFADEVRRPAPALSERRNDPLTGFTPEPLGGRPEARPEPRPEPIPSRVTRNEPMMPRPARPTEAPKAPPIRTERPAAPPVAIVPTPATPPLSAADQNLAEMAQRLEAALRRPGGETGEQRVGAPPVAPEPPANRPAPPRSEPSTAPPAAAPSPKTGFENLEDEMASLLGRPKSPS
ncbi:flagellar biosynthetic protein FliO [Bradyrhizobium canariense]|uniref:Flagellar biosynthesis protein, FliO n=1 Tax=Bradyrhizobium canariense TaxID=255045 RepID=A0A1H1MIH3_9BRAD|nr:flagellar biosynthetic protein FliO [Bradyrhizobium canariense]SDR86447.1 Flagellar biosynthesis protein, FliO [Bradyrhizobium canariense]